MLFVGRQIVFVQTVFVLQYKMSISDEATGANANNRVVHNPGDAANSVESSRPGRP